MILGAVCSIYLAYDFVHAFATAACWSCEYGGDQTHVIYAQTQARCIYIYIFAYLLTNVIKTNPVIYDLVNMYSFRAVNIF